jgi:hypothetical protein
MIRKLQGTPPRIIGRGTLMLLVLICPLFIPPSWSYDPAQPDQKIEAFVKTRLSLDGSESVLWWTGTVYASQPGKQAKLLFNFEGYNIARAIKIDGGYQVLSREAAFYSDPQSGGILTNWRNPLNDRLVEVVQVWNDPVNQELISTGSRPFNPTFFEADGQVSWNLEIMLVYPSPLPRREFPRYSQNDLYQAAELFQFKTDRRSIDDPKIMSAPCNVSWTRIGPWLPWMELGDLPGELIYHCQGIKLAKGFEGLPETIRRKVLAEHPEYAHAPEHYSLPNETSWTYFRKILDSRKNAGKEATHKN